MNLSLSAIMIKINSMTIIITVIMDGSVIHSSIITIIANCQKTLYRTEHSYLFPQSENENDLTSEKSSTFLHRLQPSWNVQDSPGFVDIVLCS